MMSRKKNLVKNSIILSAGTFLPKFIMVLATPILTAQLSKNEYGEYDLISTIVSFLLPVVTLQLSSAAFRFLIDKRKDGEECSSIISTIYAFTIIVSLVAGTVYCFVLMERIGKIGFVISIYFVLHVLQSITGQVLRGLGKNILFSLSSIVQAIVSVISLILFMGVFGTSNLGLRGAVISLTLSSLIPLVLLVSFGGILSKIKIRNISFLRLKELLRYSLPMIPNNLSGWILRLSDRLIISAVCGIEANAVYAVACKLPSIFNTLQGTFMMAWQENASLASKDDDKTQYFSEICNSINRIMIGFMSLLICVTPIIWKILIRGDYNEAYYQLPILYLGILFSGMSLAIGAVYIAHMQTKKIGITSMIAAILNIIIDALLVKRIGIWAGSISTMISFGFLFIYRIYDIQKIQVIKFEKHTLIIGIIIVSIMGYFNFRNSTLFNVINIPIAFFSVWFFDREMIKKAIGSIKHPH